MLPALMQCPLSSFSKGTRRLHIPVMINMATGPKQESHEDLSGGRTCWR